MPRPGFGPWKRELVRKDMAGPWQGPGRAAAPAPPPRDHSPGGFYHTENWDLASVKPQKSRIKRVSQTVTTWAQPCREQAEQRGSSRQCHSTGDTCQPLWHPPATLRARRGGASPEATWNKAGLPGRAGSAPYLHKSCLHKRRSKSRLAPGRHRTEMPRGRASTQGHNVAGGVPTAARLTGMGCPHTAATLCQDGVEPKTKLPSVPRWVS